MPTLVRTTSEDPNFIALVDELNAWLRIADGDKHEYYNQFNHIEGIPFVLVAYEEDRAVACGAMKPYNETTVEIKRMFTKPEVQGKGLGTTILKSLEEWARELGYHALLLETGKSFSAALHLYKKYGFEQIPNYDQYADIKDSICFQKAVDKIVN
jgi:putative acetyltransferase